MVHRGGAQASFAGREDRGATAPWFRRTAPVAARPGNAQTGGGARLPRHRPQRWVGTHREFSREAPFSSYWCSEEGDRRDRGRSGQAGTDAPPAAGRRGRRQNPGGFVVPSHGGGGRVPGGPHGADRGVGRTAPYFLEVDAGRAVRAGRRVAMGPTRRTGGTAHQPHHSERPGQFARWPSRRRHRSRRRYARPADRVRYLSPAGRGGNRRAAPFWGRAEVGAAGEVGRACARRAGYDRDPDTEDGGHDCLWRPRHHRPGRAAPGAYAGRDRMGTRPAGRGSGLADGSRRDRRRPPGLRGVPISGRVRTGPGQLRQ